MSVTFDQDANCYRIRGRLVPRVTGVLGPLYDLARIPVDVLEYKRQIGDAVHKAIEFDLQDDLDTERLDPAIQGYVRGWQKYRREREYQHRHSERKVGHHTYGYAGTLDFFGSALREVKPRQFKRVFVLGDAKSTFDMHPAVALQTVAYREALALEDADAKNAHRLGLQLKPDGTYCEHWFDNPKDWPVFLSFLTVTNWKAAHL